MSIRRAWLAAGAGTVLVSMVIATPVAALPDERGCAAGDDVVVRIDVGRNGWGGENSRFIHAELVICSDGHVTVDGRGGRIDDRAIARILRRAEKAGLLRASPDYGEPGITDQGATTVEVVDEDGRTRRVSVYALGMENVNDDHLGLTGSQLRARRQLMAFIDVVFETATR